MSGPLALYVVDENTLHVLKPLEAMQVVLVVGVAVSLMAMAIFFIVTYWWVLLIMVALALVARLLGSWADRI